MISLRSLALTLSSLTIGSTAVFAAFDTQFIGADDGNWNVPGNWSSGIPDMNSEISLNGKDVVVTDTQAYKDFDTVAPVTSGTITINDGGFLSTDGGHHGAWGITNITINSGGTFFNDPASEGGIARLRAPVDVNAGGTLTGFSVVQGVLSISGLFQPHNSASANVVPIESNTTLNAGGVIEVDVFGSGNNESFSVTSGDTLELSIVGSNLRLMPQGGYMPSVSDTFDIWDSAGTTNVIGDASNVTLQGYSVSWDTTQWASDGILSISAIPEPSTYALIAGALVLGVVALRRRNRA